MKKLNIFNDDDALEQVLTESLYRAECPPTMQLGEYKLGLLSAPEVAQVEAHLPTCTRCQAEVQETVAFLSEFASEFPNLAAELAVNAVTVDTVDTDNVDIDNEETRFENAWLVEAMAVIDQGNLWQEKAEQNFRYGLAKGRQWVLQLLQPSTLLPNTPALAFRDYDDEDSSATLPKPIATLTLQGGTGKNRFEVQTTIHPDKTNPTLCQVAMTVYLKQYRRHRASKIVSLTAQGYPTYNQTTDNTGQVVFTNIPHGMVNKPLTIAIKAVDK